MSQEINNREYRKQVIVELLTQLHAGKSVDEVKSQFESAFQGVSAQEIAAAEQELIAGGLPIEEVQRLCDVHAAVFQGTVEEIHQAVDMSHVPGHPAHTLLAENRQLEALIDEEIRPLLKDAPLPRPALSEALERLWQVDIHYVKKENLIFPYMEQHGITAPPKVMWGVDDDIRDLVKAARRAVSGGDGDEKVRTAVLVAADKLKEMIFKEEHILLPMISEYLTRRQWEKIAQESYDLGFCLIPPPPVWAPAEEDAPPAAASVLPKGEITLPTGVLNLAELNGLLDTLPIDITFVDKDDTVKYFSQGSERIFPRTKAIIGRKVINCHPPDSMHVVEKILADFKSGKRDVESFWINMAGKYIYIRYFAVRGQDGEFLGTLEVTQEIGGIQKIQGEKRLLSDDED